MNEDFRWNNLIFEKCPLCNKPLHWMRTTQAFKCRTKKCNFGEITDYKVKKICADIMQLTSEEKKEKLVSIKRTSHIDKE